MARKKFRTRTGLTAPVSGFPVRWEVAAHTDATLAEYAQAFAAATGKTVSVPVVCRALQRLNLRRKKKTLRTREGERADVAADRDAGSEAMTDLDPARLVFLDETGVTTTMTRTQARALAGDRAWGSVPFAWKRVTVLGALGLERVIAP